MQAASRATPGGHCVNSIPHKICRPALTLVWLDLWGMVQSWGLWMDALCAAPVCWAERQTSLRRRPKKNEIDPINRSFQPAVSYLSSLAARRSVRACVDCSQPHGPTSPISRQIGNRGACGVSSSMSTPSHQIVSVWAREALATSTRSSQDPSQAKHAHQSKPSIDRRSIIRLTRPHVPTHSTGRGWSQE